MLSSVTGVDSPMISTGSFFYLYHRFIAVTLSSLECCIRLQTSHRERTAWPFSSIHRFLVAHERYYCWFTKKKGTSWPQALLGSNVWRKICFPVFFCSTFQLWFWNSVTYFLIDNNNNSCSCCLNLRTCSISAVQGQSEAQNLIP